MSLDQLFHAAGFTPTEAQRAAIVHTEGPLWLVAGPGSGKTRVLLWRTLNLIVFQEVAPETVLLSTFTDKAARQLRMGLLSLLHLASKHTGKTYDIASLYVGTVHALCRKILVDPRFGDSGNPPELLDALGQYFHVYDKHWWATAGVSAEDVVAILNPPRGGSIRLGPRLPCSVSATGYRKNAYPPRISPTARHRRIRTCWRVFMPTICTA